MADEIEVGGETYKVGRLSAFDQLHVSRRLAPALPSIIGMLGMMAEVPEAAADGAAAKDAVTPEMRIVQNSGPLAEAFARMPEADVNYVVKCCLGAVERRSGAAWARIVTKPAIPGDHASRDLLFEDVGLPVMVQLVFAVVRENMGDFFSSSAPASKPAEAARQ